MTNEEIEEVIKELSESIDKLSNPEKPLTKKEEGHKSILLLQKETLEKLKVAKEKGDTRQEFSLTVTYGLLTSVGEKYPFLMMLIKAKSGIGI